MPARDGNERSSLRKGILHRRKFNTTGPWFPFGNCEAVNFGAQTEAKEVKRYTRANAGNANKIERISSVPINVTMLDWTGENEAFANAGSLSEASSGTATEEAVTVFAGATTPLAKIPTAITEVKSADGDGAPARANSQAYAVGDFYVPATPNGHYYKVTVAGTSAASPPTFTTDGSTFADGTATVQDMGLIVLATSSYERTFGGVYVPDAATFGGISATVGVPVLVTYTYPATQTIEALLGIGEEWELYYEGEDEMQSGLVTRAFFYRAKFGAAQQVDMVGDDPGKLQITGELLPDDSVTGTGLSQYYKIEKTKAA